MYSENDVNGIIELTINSYSQDQIKQFRITYFNTVKKRLLKIFRVIML